MPNHWLVNCILPPVAAASLSCEVARGGPAEERPATDQPAFRLFYVFPASSEVRKVCEQLGFEPMPLVTQWRFFNAREDRFDPDKYQRLIWTPGRPTGYPPDVGGWEQHGVPPDYPGWIDLDFERPLTVARAEEYKALIRETRRLRPRARICLHGYILRRRAEGERAKLVDDIVSRCDAVSPPIYPNFRPNFSNLKQQLDLHRNRLRFCLELKSRHGVKVFPIVWKRYLRAAAKDSGTSRSQYVTPPAIARQFAELVVGAEHEGHRVDGVIVFGNDALVLHRPQTKRKGVLSHSDTADQQAADRSDVEFLRIVADAARATVDASAGKSTSSK